jgi:pimeloyl-ACP methyl ester carboxylesterase
VNGTVPAVFVHGVPDTHHVWDALRSHLARSDVVALSLPGFGCPRPEGFAATKEAYAAWLVAELRAIGEPVDLVGHDWGGMLVQYVGSSEPGLVRTWAAGNSPVDREYEWHPAAQLWQTPDVGEQVMASMTAELWAGGLESEGVPPAEARATAARIDDTMTGCILDLYRSAVDVGAEWQPVVEANQRPALTIWGGADAAVPRDVGERQAARVGGPLVMFDDCPHWWPVARAAEAAAALEGFWAG